MSSNPSTRFTPAAALTARQHQANIFHLTVVCTTLRRRPSLRCLLLHEYAFKLYAFELYPTPPATFAPRSVEQEATAAAAAALRRFTRRKIPVVGGGAWGVLLAPRETRRRLGRLDSPGMPHIRACVGCVHECVCMWVFALRCPSERREGASYTSGTNKKK